MIPIHKTLLAAGMVALLGLAACGDDESTTGDEASTTTTGSAAGDGTATDGTAASGDEAAACDNDLEIVNASAADVEGLEDGPVEVVTAWADEGPHPDNTVDYDTTLSGMISESEIPVDPQFGYSIPVGTPTLPEDALYLSFDLGVPDGAIAADQTFVPSTSDESADGSIDFYAVYLGAERLLPGDATITITALTDEVVCGEITTSTDTDVQSFVGIEGTFRLDRIQALEAAEEG
ncbi:MAG: hypothetical protein MUF83_18230 [Acidimicrobiales bacterium]|jgi:hypothetical protein|nr:hypothetical protein [Acidimicrobiales bacterium]